MTTAFSAESSRRRPATFLSPMKMSFGHLIRAPRSNSFLMARATAMAAAIVTMKTRSMGNVGFRMMVVQMPPGGDAHARPSLPCPPVCSSAITMKPSSFCGSCWQARSLAIQVVDSVVSRYFIRRPITLVPRCFWIS